MFFPARLSLPKPYPARAGQPKRLPHAVDAMPPVLRTRRVRPVHRAHAAKGNVHNKNRVFYCVVFTPGATARA